MVEPKEPIPIQPFASKAKWEAWLEKHHRDSPGVWLMIAKKASGVPSVTYDEALDSALCFGWIDGQKKSHNETHFLQKFTPRRKGSLWSQRNVEKVEALIKAGLMRAAGQAEIDLAKTNGRWDAAYGSSKTIEVAPDFQAALDANPNAQTFFDTLTKSQRYSFLWRIETAKRLDTRERRIREYTALLAQKKTLQ
jgi:uncharacterized protein YdeI (YjbR/CyaY-like superfamily)